MRLFPFLSLSLLSRTNTRPFNQWPGNLLRVKADRSEIKTDIVYVAPTSIDHFGFSFSYSVCSGRRA